MGHVRHNKLHIFYNFIKIDLYQLVWYTYVACQMACHHLAIADLCVICSLFHSNN